MTALRLCPIPFTILGSNEGNHSLRLRNNSKNDAVCERACDLEVLLLMKL